MAEARSPLLPTAWKKVLTAAASDAQPRTAPQANDAGQRGKDADAEPLAVPKPCRDHTMRHGSGQDGPSPQLRVTEGAGTASRVVVGRNKLIPDGDAMAYLTDHRSPAQDPRGVDGQ